MNRIVSIRLKYLFGDAVRTGKRKVWDNCAVLPSDLLAQDRSWMTDPER